MRERSTWPVIAVVFLALQTVWVFAQTANNPELQLSTGKEIYQAACIGSSKPDAPKETAP
jgi:hypothetical protein